MIIMMYDAVWNWEGYFILHKKKIGHCKLLYYTVLVQTVGALTGNERQNLLLLLLLLLYLSLLPICHLVP